MFAIVTNVRVENPDDTRLLLPEAREALVSRARGIVSGYWLGRSMESGCQFWF